jgi:formylmethanofuran dehydrogenase subunit A
VTRGGTHTVRPEYDRGIEHSLKEYFDRYRGIRMENFKISRNEMAEGIGSPVMSATCAPRAAP